MFPAGEAFLAQTISGHESAAEAACASVTLTGLKFSS
jgi:hypothetical protein